MKYLLLAGCLFLASCEQPPCPLQVGDLVFIKAINKGPYVVSEVFGFCSVEIIDGNLKKITVHNTELLEKRADPRG